jgi:hypothetical protein
MAAAVNGSVASGGITPPELAAMLRRSAEIVERRDFHPLLYQTMKALTAYAGDYAHGSSASKSATTQGSSVSSNTPRKIEESSSAITQTKAKSAFHDVPDSLLDSSVKQPQTAALNNNRSSGGGAAGAAQKMGAPGGQFSSAAASASGKSQDKQHKGGFTKGLKGIRKGFEKLGADLIGDHHTSKDYNDDIPFDEQAWCEEHFTRGCACKSRKNVEKTKDTFSDQPESSPARVNNDSDKKSKPCFQRPINPNSNLIANGWIDQQRRSKMRVVWKDVLASLVEGRRPGEETTLWIQRQVIDPQTGKITGLEALHQIPMKWLEDVNYVDIYGDYRFTLKVYNFAEEFYFRTRDEQSAQSWVITLRSARDASLENIGRISDDDKWMKKESPPKEMGLDSLEGNGKIPINKPSSSIDPPTAQEAIDNSEKNAASPVQTQQQQQTNTGRMKIAELRAIAHGAGYNTRGMERKDLEKIVANVNGSFPASSASAEGSDTLRHSMQHEAMMRDAERRQREELELRERERELQERAEILRLEQQAERERKAAEQRSQQEAQLQRQMEEMKRRQEEERLKRLAEIQAAEARRKQEEENMRRDQQRSHIPSPPPSTHIPTPPSSGGAPFNQQQQRTHIPTPPSSGSAPFHHQQQQQQWGQPQQYHQWQQQQQHPQQHAQYQQQAYATQQSQQSQNPQFNQNVHHQGGGYQQSHFQQQQPQPQQQQQQQQHASDSKYAKQMYEKSDEEQSAANIQIKRSILINWALLPPNLNALRPIDQLITSIHTAMPPAFGVPGHNYFAKFTPISHSELVVSAAMGNHPDENKLKKAVRKVRVFLHPDKLPRDLSSEQSFMARMLWDITSDSWEEFLKHKDELDWIRS